MCKLYGRAKELGDQLVKQDQKEKLSVIGIERKVVATLGLNTTGRFIIPQTVY